MKAKSKKIVIIVVAAVLVVALAGTGIFFALKNGGEAVKVTPVSNVSGGFGGGNNEISDYGNVTTNMNQDIYCDDTLTITQVFVQEGDAVKTGDPLIAYDTTLLSLELEMKQMEIDGLGLQMQSIQQEINQLRGMNPATTGRAALDSAGLFYNVSSSGGEFRHESLVAGRTCASNANVGNENGLMNLSAAGQPENSDSSGAGVTSPGDGAGLPGEGESQPGGPQTPGEGTNPPGGSDSSGEGGNPPGGLGSLGEGEDPSGGSDSSGEDRPDGTNPPEGDQNPPGGNEEPARPMIGTPFPEELRGKEIHTMISAESQAYNQEEADGSAEHPYRFLCAPGAAIDASFMMGVLGGQTVCVFEVVDDVQNPSYILYSWSLDGRVPESDDPVVEPDVPVGPSYEEIQRLIKEKEEQLKELSLNKRAAELELRKLQKKLNNGIVTSTVDGTVKSVQDEENAKLQGTPLISVVGEEGFYITGTVAETALDKVPVGMPITVNSWNSGAMYEATITGVGTAPMQGYYGNNANMSYYPFTAVIKGDADLHNGEGVGISVDGMGQMGGGDGIYLDQAFVREEGNQYYVYKKGENDRLTKQYVEVGKIVYGSYEIRSGLSMEDEIAFPYGKDVKEGARTESVDSLYEYY